MNQIRSIQNLSLRELENGVLSPTASWHHEYKDQAYVYIGGLNKELTEGDVLTVFSQYGVPVDICLVRDRETAESKGFCYLKYEDQRSSILAVDNLNGSIVAGRAIKVDHTVYRPRDEDWEYREAVRDELKRDLDKSFNSDLAKI
ncbi:LAQU0S04e03972g1_1 [Lachancea quebecensis]|uniref:LAQU0S04e03972g1_1 n=1 Tax=Lachancea quebecensis TaxID=1654605 RepID=A0A0N7MLC8_9SACH|nr:LAQU0S04e03972g1_1 [Lachancea quebecensis]